MEAFKRLYEAALRGGKRGWNPDDPIGLDPSTILNQQQPGGMFYGPGGLINQAVGTPAIAFGDTALRGLNTALHGGAALVNQGAREAGWVGPHDKRGERDILSIPEAFAGGVGRLFGVTKQAPGVMRQGSATMRQAGPTVKRGVRYVAQPIDEALSQSWQTERLLEFGGRPVKMGEVTDSHVADFRKVIPQEAAEAFQKADRSVYASEGLVDSLRLERERHADRLIREMPAMLKNAEVRGNTNPATAHRPMLVRPTTDIRRKNKFDVMILDAMDSPGRIGIPTIETMRKGTVQKGRKP